MGRKKGFTIGKARTGLYGAARILGDVNSVARGTVPQRIFSRVIGGFFSALLGGLVRAIFGGRR